MVPLPNDRLREASSKSSADRLLEALLYRPDMGRGNIDLNHRQVVTDSDGTIHTELSKSFNFDGQEVLLPTVVNGQIVSDQDAIAHYRKTGEYLGKFSSPDEADAYAQALHERQSVRYGTR